VTTPPDPSSHRLTNERKEQVTLGQRVADGVAATMGSWRFIIIQSVVLTAWIAVNVTEVLFHAWDAAR
jgi:uncharacterized membrane protein